MGFQSWDGLAMREERELGFEMREEREGLGLHDWNFRMCEERVWDRRESLRWDNIPRELLGFRVWVWTPFPNNNKYQKI